MKNLRILFPILLVCFCLAYRPVYDAVRKVPKTDLVPPGTVWLKDNMFMDKTEITNSNYREFLYCIKAQHRSKSYCDSMLPDTTTWCKKYDKAGMQTGKMYFRHPSYQEYPVVGISYYQAVEFCKWRTERVNYFEAIKKNLAKWVPDTIYHGVQFVNYRLPTKEEWEYAAAAGLDKGRYPYGYENITDDKNEEVSITAEYVNLHEKGFNYPVNSESVNFGKPNKYDLYNMLGNVAEIIDCGQYKGLSFNDYLVHNDSTYSYTQTWKYTKPECWLGFRCICEVLKR